MPASRPLIIAHRGASGYAPENTLTAFRLAADLGADGVELDVNLSADGQPVVIHDQRLNRTTNRTGLVSSCTAQELAGVHAGFMKRSSLKRRPIRGSQAVIDGHHSGVPTLDEVLSLLAQLDISRIYVEIKGARADRINLLEVSLQAIERSDLKEAVTILSFDHGLMAYVKRMNQSLRTALTFHLIKGAIPATRAIMAAAARAQTDEVALHHALATRRRVETLHKRGLSVSAWTANARLTMKRLVDSGVDSIMTNYPDRLGEVIRLSRASEATRL